ncbi:MAG: AMP-binding protein, partial [Terriglobales bacterium]
MIDDSSRALLSYDHGICAEPLLGRTIGEHISMIAAANPTGMALISCQQGQSYTYAQLKERIDLLARGFLKLGIERGDRIGLWSTNNVEWIIVQLAAAEVGAVLVNINPAYRTHELEYALRQSGCRLLAVIPNFKSSDYLSMLNGLAHNLFCRDREHEISCLPQLE